VPNFIIAKQIPHEFHAFSFLPFSLYFTTEKIRKTPLYSVAEIATGVARISE
jgi:hypothetical protein